MMKKAFRFRTAGPVHTGNRDPVSDQLLSAYAAKKKQAAKEKE